MVRCGAVGGIEGWSRLSWKDGESSLKCGVVYSGVLYCIVLDWIKGAKSLSIHTFIQTQTVIWEVYLRSMCV